MKLADFPQIQTLSLDEKIELVEELWLAIGPELQSLGVSQEEKQLLDQRWDRFVSDPSSALAEEEFFRKFEARQR